ncbi:hypothetical protein BpHYR1_034490 [Brachionus plicatilis]|uniref:Uncharacterized protein n=1 Tax=Brachionus plicatilis TaxID=10195 RepID=A0A3M7RPH7_BRAPC|nr:hypothetical protein BpHYR1_034490 [Brachionus plicatilis]
MVTRGNLSDSIISLCVTTWFVSGDNDGVNDDDDFNKLTITSMPYNLRQNFENDFELLSRCTSSALSMCLAK